jgi:putative ABC transport system permease protein
MKTADSLQWVSRAVLAQRGRSALTALGIAIGIAAVALLTSVGEGLRIYLLDNFSMFGTRTISITAGKTSTQGLAGLLKTVRPLTFSDAEQLRRLPNVEAVTPVVIGSVRVESADRQRNTELQGVGADAARARRMTIALGRFLPEGEDSAARPYAVLGSKLRTELFGTQNPLGQMLRVGGMRFRVIGVFEPKGQFLGFDLDEFVYIPASRAAQLMNREGVNQIDVSFSEKTTSAETGERIKRALTALHGEEDFTLFTQEDMLKSLDRILRLVTMAIGGLGGISLLVGGVGVTTIMSTALRERMAEIGLLRALGATRPQLLQLFLGEAVLLASVGGAVGVSLVMLVIVLINWLAPALPFTLQPFYLVMSWLLSTLVGLLAGIAPAWRASLFDPIEALRME